MQRSKSSKLRRKLYMVWYHIKERCYDKTHERYHLYGEKGVTLAEEWLDLNTFYEEIKEVEGYCEVGVLEGKIHLDKDIKIPGNKIYSKNTCMFVSKEVNNRTKPNQMFPFKAISPEGEEFISYNQSEFARSKGLHQGKISNCLNKKQQKHQGWVFEHVER